MEGKFGDLNLRWDIMMILVSHVNGGIVMNLFSQIKMLNDFVTI